MRIAPLFLLCMLLPFSARAINAERELTPEQIQDQQWDSECRERMPSGQGDLEAALLRLLRDCINQKRAAKAGDDWQRKELDRLSKRTEREQERRAFTLTRIRGSALRVQGAMQRRTEQGTVLQQIRTKGDYQRIHRTLRGVRVPSATED